MSSPEFPHAKIGVRGRWRQRVISDVSDGDQKHWPPKPAYRPCSDENYLIRLGQEWADRDRVSEPGIQYYINKLPDGYATFETFSTDGRLVYKRLFGHPSEKYYDSVPTFLPHFLWLQDGMQGNCTCKPCGTQGSVATMVPRARMSRNALEPSAILPSRITRDVPTRESGSSTRESSITGIASGRVRRDVKQSGAPYAKDEEGTEDVYKLFAKRLQNAQNSARSMDDDIREANSLDWRAEHEHGDYGSDILPTHITQIEQQHSFVPRVGELVLWCPNFLDKNHLMLDKATSEYKFYSFHDKRFHGHPEWRAGVITAVPSTNATNGSVDFPDILDTPEKKTALNTAGFRVETLPDPNDPLNKAMSKQYRFVPLRSMRPLSQWQSVLRGVPEKRLHPSIKNAFTVMTSVSLVEKYKAVGHWPAATVFCKGLFLGSELIVVGDTVRLVSEESSKKCTDVLHVNTIRLNLEDMRPEHVEPQSRYLCSKSSITLVGAAYTLEKNRHFEVPSNQMIDDDLELHIVPTPVSRDTVKVMFRPVGSAEYGPWYRLHPHGKGYEVSYDQVLGRLYEAEAVRLWAGQRQEKVRNGEVTKPPPLDFDAAGILSARHYATQVDERLPEPQGNEISWFWADTRAQALDVATFNGLEVGKYHDVRDKATIESWNYAVKVLNGHQVTVSDTLNYTSVFPTGARGRKPGSKLVNGKVVYPGDPDYPGVPSNEGEAMNARPKASSQMAGAAMASTDEESGAGEDDDDIEVVGEQKSRNNSDEMLAKFTTKPQPQPAKKSLTKEQIMSTAVMDSIEGAQEFDDDVSEEEEPWWEQPVVVRGGTEESEGGDYDPTTFSRKPLLPGGRKSKSKYYYDSDEA